MKAVEENIFAWGYQMEPGMQCHAEIVQVENALTHATSYIHYANTINKISLYESRLNRIIVRNTDLLNKRQAERRNRIDQPAAAPIAEPAAQTASATAQGSGLIPTKTKAQTDAPGQIGFAFTDSPQPQTHPVEPSVLP